MKVIERIKKLLRRESSGEFCDHVIGILVSKHSGIWLGSVPFGCSGRIQVLVPGNRQQPDPARLDRARRIVRELASVLDAALDFVTEQRSKVFRERLQLVGLNFFSGANDFALAGG